MEKRRIYSCPRCAARMRWIEIFRFMNSQKHFCPSCGLQVKPKYKMSGQMGFAVTFIAFFLPFEFFFRFKNRWALGMAMGSLGWLIITIFVVVYTYLTVEFEPEE